MELRSLQDNNNSTKKLPFPQPSTTQQAPFLAIRSNPPSSPSPSSSPSTSPSIDASLAISTTRSAQKRFTKDRHTKVDSETIEWLLNQAEPAIVAATRTGTILANFSILNISVRSSGSTLSVPSSKLGYYHPQYEEEGFAQTAAFLGFHGQQYQIAEALPGSGDHYGRKKYKEDLLKEDDEGRSEGESEAGSASKGFKEDSFVPSWVIRHSNALPGPIIWVAPPRGGPSSGGANSTFWMLLVTTRREERKTWSEKKSYIQIFN